MRWTWCCVGIPLLLLLLWVLWVPPIPSAEHAALGDAGDSIVPVSADPSVPFSRVPTGGGGRAVGASGQDRFLKCLVLDIHTRQPIVGIEVGFVDVAGAPGPAGVSDDQGVVVCACADVGDYRARVLSYGFAGSAEGCLLRTLSASDLATAELATLTVITLYAACVSVVGEQPYDGVFTWSRPPSIASVDVADLQRNMREAERLHGKGVQLYPLSPPNPLVGELALFFVKQGVIKVPVTQQRLVDLVPFFVESVGLPAAPGAAGFLDLRVGDEAGRDFEFGPVALMRSEPLHGFRISRMTAGVTSPLPPGHYNVGLGGLPIPWIIEEARQVHVVEGETAECRLKAICRLRSSVLKVGGVGRRAGVQFSWVPEAGGTSKWGPLVSAGDDNVLRVVLPVGLVRWRLFSGPDDKSEGRELIVPDGNGEFVESLAP